MELAHLKSPNACLLYKFIFKRYLEEDNFTDKEISCIYDEVTSAVRRFAKLGNLASRKNSVNSLEQQYYYDVIVDPCPTPLYRFLFNSYSPQNAVPTEDFHSIYIGLMEVAKRLDSLRTSRGLGGNMYSDRKESPCNSSSHDDDPSESDNEDGVKCPDRRVSVESNGNTENQSLRGLGSGSRDGRKSDDEKLDEVVNKFSNISLDPKDVSIKDNRSHDLNDKSVSTAAAPSPCQKKSLSNGNNRGNQDMLEPRPLKPVEVKEICTNAHSSSPANHGKTSSPSILRESGLIDSKVNAIGQVQREMVQNDSCNIAPGGDSRNIAPSSCLPDRDRIRLTEFIKPYDGIRVSLTGSPSKNCDGKRLNRPLGVTYDEALEQWIVADTGNDRVVLAPSGTVVTSPKMLAPCAVVVVEPGFSFAVLTKYDIRIMYYNKKGADLVINHSGSARGLALTPRRNFLILEKIKGFWNICVYEGKPNATLVNSAPYPKIENSLPSFLDVHRDLLIITDLGSQSLVRFYIDAKTDKLKLDDHFYLGKDPKNRGHIEIKYISGVFIDNDENILVADAKGRTLQMFTSRGIFLHAIKVVSGGLPYISGIWVNRNGYIGACARAETNGGLYVYRIVVPPQTDYKIPSLRSRTS
ncbi:hypothetical protein GCK32_000713 [Trichostrongylus colubriformis]|uniref:Uncharacterized protein n=1 Tax=Trichostrongylus colubriformis TaxID=6319 RepID=A0AAN8IFE1_TRICO